MLVLAAPPKHHSAGGLAFPAQPLPGTQGMFHEETWFWVWDSSFVPSTYDANGSFLLSSVVSVWDNPELYRRPKLANASGK